MLGLSWQLVWNCVFLVVGGIFLLRISGRKSISQMTVAATVIMISIGELLAHGILDDTAWKSIIAVGLFLLILMILERIELGSKMFQKWVSGEAISVICEGSVDYGRLKKLRMTYKQLEMRLRQKGILHITDIQTATIEINGELSYELKRHAQPVTIGDLEKLLLQWGLKPMDAQPSNATNLFAEPTLSHNSGEQIIQ